MGCTTNYLEHNCVHVRIYILMNFVKSKHIKYKEFKYIVIDE